MALPLRSRASESIVFSFVSENSDYSETQFSQLSKASQQDQAPGAHNGEQLNNVSLDWFSFLPFIIFSRTLPLSSHHHTHTPLLPSGMTSQSKPTTSKSLSQTLPFERIQDKTFDIGSRLRKQATKRGFWN